MAEPLNGALGVLLAALLLPLAVQSLPNHAGPCHAGGPLAVGWGRCVVGGGTSASPPGAHLHARGLSPPLRVRGGSNPPGIPGEAGGGGGHSAAAGAAAGPPGLRGEGAPPATGITQGSVGGAAVEVGGKGAGGEHQQQHAAQAADKGWHDEHGGGGDPDPGGRAGGQLGGCKDPLMMSEVMQRFASIGRFEHQQKGTPPTAPPMVLEDLLQSVGSRNVFPVLVFLTVLPNCIPGPPLLNFVFGIPLCAICLQSSLGFPRPWLPRAIYRAHLPRHLVIPVFRMALPFITRMEALLAPRWTSIFSNALADRVLGLFTLSLALALTMPVPFTTQPSSISLAITTMGVAARDGKCVGVGVILGVLSECLLYWTVRAIVFVGKKAVDKFGHQAPPD